MARGVPKRDAARVRRHRAAGGAVRLDGARRLARGQRHRRAGRCQGCARRREEQHRQAERAIGSSFDLRRHPCSNPCPARHRLERTDGSRPGAAQRGLGVVGRLVRGRRTPGRDAAPHRVRLLYLRVGCRHRRAWHCAGLASPHRAAVGNRRTGRARRRVRRNRQCVLWRPHREGSPQAARASRSSTRSARRRSPPAASRRPRSPARSCRASPTGAPGSISRHQPCQRPLLSAAVRSSPPFSLRASSEKQLANGSFIRASHR